MATHINISPLTASVKHHGHVVAIHQQQYRERRGDVSKDIDLTNNKYTYSNTYNRERERQKKEKEKERESPLASLTEWVSVSDYSQNNGAEVQFP